MLNLITKTKILLKEVNFVLHSCSDLYYDRQKGECA